MPIPIARSLSALTTLFALAAIAALPFISPLGVAPARDPALGFLVLGILMGAQSVAAVFIAHAFFHPGAAAPRAPVELLAAGLSVVIVFAILIASGVAFGSRASIALLAGSVASSSLVGFLERSGARRSLLR